MLLLNKEDITVIILIKYVFDIMSYYVRSHQMAAFFSKKVTLCPLSRNVCLPFDKITSLSPPPQNVRLFRKFVTSSLPRKIPMVWNNLHIISAAILPKNTRPNYSVTICWLTFRQKLYSYEETKLQFTVFKMSIW